MKELLYALPAGMELPRGDYGLTPVHLRYRVGQGPRLMGHTLTPALRGGVMLVGGQMEEGDPSAFCGQLAGECGKRGFSGVILDVEGAPTEGLGRMVSAVGSICRRQGLTLYLPEPLALYTPGCRVLIPSALRNGTLEGRLRAAAERCGGERITLAVQVVAEDCPLPAKGPGEPLSREGLDGLLKRLEPAVFFDRGLCAHYFTYMPQAGQAHFVLFDTAKSVREKLALAERLGITSVLLAAPQVAGWLDEIFEREVS